MDSALTPFNRENPMHAQHVLFDLNHKERQYVMAMAKRLGISVMQAARQLAHEKERARRSK